MRSTWRSGTRRARRALVHNHRPHPVGQIEDLRLQTLALLEGIEHDTGTTYTSDTTIIYPYEQLFLNIGLSLTINQVPYPNDTAKDGTHYTGNGLLSAPAAIYADSTRIWLGGVPDNDIPGSPMNWIRAGTYDGGSDPNLYDWNLGSSNSGEAWDPNENYAKIQGGTWAPYCLAVANDQVSAIDSNVSPAVTKASKTRSTMDRLASVNIVITPDQTKWTRSPVIEMCPDPRLSEGGAPKFALRRHPSVNIDGDTGVVSDNPIYNSSFINRIGMGWFPGYAINLETGERLNIMFGENSWLSSDNGRDLLWNPTSRIFDDGLRPVFGGMHYVYIMGSMRTTIKQGPETFSLDFPAYDGGAYLVSHLNLTPSQIWQAYGYGSCMYVGMPLAIDGKQWLSNEVTIKIRILKTL